MTLDWQAAASAIIHHPLFGLGVTLAAYQVAATLYARTRLVFMQPVLVSMLLVVGTLLACGLSYTQYRQGTDILGTLLGPATVALAVPLYLNLRRIRQLLWPTLITLTIGGIAATASGVWLGWCFGADRETLMTMAPKSATSPIAMLVAEQLGGAPALAAVFVLGTGVIGGILGPGILRVLKVQAPEARGMALGLSSHAVGTSVALQDGETCGGFAALGMSLMGVATAIFLPLAVSLFV